MDYYTEEGAAASSASSTTIAHIADGCVAVIFGLLVLYFLLKCCCTKSDSPVKIEQPSTAPANNQHDHSMLVINPGDRNPTCIAMPVSSPQHTPDPV
ncbi:hypothetical protein RND71_029706 [Anisodus tanguticus]|uniref:Uncharacterized protein n=1 Tax=Anisodus tanguticus TaxID=243964 RepID=A0AAE1UYZ3_9SOLA|nr:hypothetical protein RND71_029706 [Anisodus tanguticus]